MRDSLLLMLLGLSREFEFCGSAFGVVVVFVNMYPGAYDYGWGLRGVKVLNFTL